MKPPTTRSRLLLGAVMATALGGATLTTLALVDRDDPPVEVAVGPAASAEASDQPAEVPRPAGPGSEAADGEAPSSAEPGVAAPDQALREQPLPKQAFPKQAVEAPRVAETSIVECGDDWQPSAEEIAQANEENRALAEVLAAAGVDAEATTDPVGFEYVGWDYSDGVAQAVVNSFYRSRYPDEGSFEEVISEEDLEHIRDENASLMAALDDAGIAYELVAEAAGFEWVEWDYEDPAARDVVDGFYGEHYGDEFDEGFEFGEAFEGELHEACFGGEEWEPSQDEIDQNNAETEAMAAAFEAAGIDYTIQDDELGFRWLDRDFEDREAQAVADAFWGHDHDQMAAEISADLDRLAAAFDAAGIEYVREGHEECETIIFDTADDAALLAVATLG
jgi:hypothetical protein